MKSVPLLNKTENEKVDNDVLNIKQDVDNKIKEKQKVNINISENDKKDTFEINFIDDMTKNKVNINIGSLKYQIINSCKSIYKEIDDSYEVCVDVKLLNNDKIVYSLKYPLTLQFLNILAQNELSTLYIDTIRIHYHF
jgi:hypothetical protein